MNTSAYKQGHTAAFSNGTEEDNPFDSYMEEGKREDWFEGFKDGCFELDMIAVEAREDAEAWGEPDYDDSFNYLLDELELERFDGDLIDIL